MSDSSGVYFMPGFGYVPYSGFWGPIGDIYPLTPVWSQHHVPQGLAAVSSTEADLAQDLIVPFGPDYKFTVDLTDQGASLTSTSDDLPAGDPSLTYRFSRAVSAVTAPFGWAQTWSMNITPNGGEDDWDGTLTCVVDGALQAKIGFDRACPYRLQVFLADRITDEEMRVDVLFGNIVVRA